MELEIDLADVLEIKNSEISELLTEVYVGGGFVKSDEAVSLFEPSAVRERGVLIGVREHSDSTLVGMVIFVPPDSPARRLAKNNEAEIHLLAVKPDYRRRGIGRMLVQSAVDKAKSIGCSTIILWTQTIMKSAQKLYKKMGFVPLKDIEKNDRKFTVYEMKLDP